MLKNLIHRLSWSISIDVCAMCCSLKSQKFTIFESKVIQNHRCCYCQKAHQPFLWMFVLHIVKCIFRACVVRRCACQHFIKRIYDKEKDGKIDKTNRITTAGTLYSFLCFLWRNFEPVGKGVPLTRGHKKGTPEKVLRPQIWLLLQESWLFYYLLYTDCPCRCHGPMLSRVKWVLLKLLVKICLLLVWICVDHSNQITAKHEPAVSTSSLVYLEEWEIVVGTVG